MGPLGSTAPSGRLTLHRGGAPLDVLDRANADLLERALPGPGDVSPVDADDARRVWARDVVLRDEARDLLAAHPARELSVAEIAWWGLPRPGLPAAVNAWRARNARHLARGARRVLAARAARLPTFYGALWLIRHPLAGPPVDYGLASLRVVTTAGVGFLVDCLQGLVEPEVLKYHGLGTGTNAEASSDTALQTEITAGLNPDNTRATGTQGEGAAANVYRTTGANTFDASVAVTEHGIFSQAATGGGTLLDRSVFAVQNFVSGESLTTQYDLTIPAGS